MEPPGVPIDTGDFADESQLRMGAVKTAVHFLRQGLHGTIELLFVLFLVGFKPRAFIVEADAPHEIYRLACKTCKHGEILLYFSIPGP